ncbi:hypothetical protein YC2023_052516 [Brassica napus]
MPSATANLPPRVTSLTSTPSSQLRSSAASTPSSSSSASPLSPSPSHSPPPSSCSPTPTAPVRLTGTISTPSGSVSPFSARKRIKREFGNWRSEIAFLFTNSRSWQTRSWRYIRSSKWELAFGSFPEKQRYGLKRFKYGSTLVTTRYVFSYLLLSAGSAAAALARSNDEGR